MAGWDLGAAVARLEELIREYYVIPQRAEEVAAVAADWHEALGDVATSPADAAAALTTVLREASNDWHFSVQARQLSQDEAAAAPEDRWKHTMPGATDNYGFRSVEVADGVATLTVTALVPIRWSEATARAAMAFIGAADAVVIDLRRCGGGDPDLIGLLASYFLSEKVELSSVRWRDSAIVEPLWTDPSSTEFQFSPRVALFVVVGSSTASGAEALADHLQARGRAIVVGQSTLGAAHRIKTFPVDGELVANIPCGQVTNPITQSDWEDGGVIPNIAVDLDADSLEVALGLARLAAAGADRDDDR